MEIHLLQAQSTKSGHVLPEELVAARTKPRAQPNRRAGIQMRDTYTGRSPIAVRLRFSRRFPFQPSIMVTKPSNQARYNRHRAQALYGGQQTLPVKKRFTVEVKTRLSRPSRAAFKLGSAAIHQVKTKLHPRRQKNRMQRQTRVHCHGCTAKPPRPEGEGCRLTDYAAN